MRQMNSAVLSAADASSSQTSITINSADLHLASAQVVITGTAAGAVKLQASNDAPTSGAVSNWSDISGATVSVSGAGAYLIPELDVCYNHLQAVFTRSSGTGTITVNVHLIGYA